MRELDQGEQFLTELLAGAIGPLQAVFAPLVLHDLGKRQQL
jgi:hypothetical protein